jgi:hypothetical protein
VTDPNPETNPRTPSRRGLVVAQGVEYLGRIAAALESLVGLLGPRYERTPAGELTLSTVVGRKPAPPPPDGLVMDAVHRLVRNDGDSLVSRDRIEALLTLLVVTDGPDRRPRELVATALSVLDWKAQEER